MKIYVSEDADFDLLNIHSYTAERNPAAAVSLAHEFEDKFASLSRFPSMGRDRSNLVKGIGVWWQETLLSFIELSLTR